MKTKTLPGQDPCSLTTGPRLPSLLWQWGDTICTSRERMPSPGHRVPMADLCPKTALPQRTHFTACGSDSREKLEGGGSPIIPKSIESNYHKNISFFCHKLSHIHKHGNKSLFQSFFKLKVSLGKRLGCQEKIQAWKGSSVSPEGFQESGQAIFQEGDKVHEATPGLSMGKQKAPPPHFIRCTGMFQGWARRASGRVPTGHVVWLLTGLS